MDVNKPLTARLTSTYDQCFDDCKAAIALEEKDEIAAADQLWKTVVERIHGFRRIVPPTHVFRCETELHPQRIVLNPSSPLTRPRG